MYWMLWLSDRSCGISIGVFRHFSEILWILFEAFFANFCLVLLIFRVFLFSNFRKKNRKNWKFFVFFFDHWRFYSLPHIFPWNSKKYLCNLNFFNILFKISHEFPIFPGSTVSPQSIQIYEKRNQANNKIVRFTYSYFWVAIVAVHIVPALCPLCYVILGSPQPDVWHLPLDIDKAYIPLSFKRNMNCKIFSIFFFRQNFIFKFF